MEYADLGIPVNSDVALQTFKRNAGPTWALEYMGENRFSSRILSNSEQQIIFLMDFRGPKQKSLKTKPECTYQRDYPDLNSSTYYRYMGSKIENILLYFSSISVLPDAFIWGEIYCDPICLRNALQNSHFSKPPRLLSHNLMSLSHFGATAGLEINFFSCQPSGLTLPKICQSGFQTVSPEILIEIGFITTYVNNA